MAQAHLVLSDATGITMKNRSDAASVELGRKLPMLCTRTWYGSKTVKKPPFRQMTAASSRPGTTLKIGTRTNCVVRSVATIIARGKEKAASIRAAGAGAQAELNLQEDSR